MADAWPSTFFKFLGGKCSNIKTWADNQKARKPDY